MGGVLFPDCYFVDNGVDFGKGRGVVWWEVYFGNSDISDAWRRATDSSNVLTSKV